MTGKTERCLYISNGMDVGVDPTTIAISTGHKDHRSLHKYAHVSNDALASGSLEQAKRLRKNETLSPALTYARKVHTLAPLQPARHSKMMAL